MTTGDQSMRRWFPGHYRPSDETFASLWERALFVFDANVLLNVYRYSPSTRSEFFHTLKAIRTRIWVPHQAAKEFEENRLKVIQQQRDTYDQFKNELSSLKNKLKARAEQSRHHPILRAEDVGDLLDEGLNELEEYLEERKDLASELFSKSGGLFVKDQIRDELNKVVGPRVGAPFSEDDLNQIYDEGADRYAKGIPPGFRDAEKETPRRYGDLVLWKQVLRKASDEVSGIILITDENKDDWWWGHGSLTIGPRPELVAEMQNIANADFYMYSSSQFLDHARHFLKQDVSDSALEEAERIRAWSRQDEDKQGGNFYTRLDLDLMLQDGVPASIVCMTVGITESQLEYWSRTGLLHPSVGQVSGFTSEPLYSFRDVLDAILVKQLIDLAIPLQSVRRTLTLLRRIETETLLDMILVVSFDGDIQLVDTEEEAERLIARAGGQHVIHLLHLEREFWSSIGSLEREFGSLLSWNRNVRALKRHRGGHGFESP